MKTFDSPFSLFRLPSQCGPIPISRRFRAYIGWFDVFDLIFILGVLRFTWVSLRGFSPSMNEKVLDWEAQYFS